MNRGKSPEDWSGDIDRSVGQYDEWYLRESPTMWVHARRRAVGEAGAAMEAFDDFGDVSVGTLRANPGCLAMVRMAVSPKMARERFIKFAGVKKSLVETMERKGALPKRAVDVDASLRRICEFVVPLFDPELFPWLADRRKPTRREREDALLILGERRAGANYDSELRNAQEARQKVLMRSFLESHGFGESPDLALEMPAGAFAFGRNVPIPQGVGKNRNLPVDCVIAPKRKSLPLVCIEMKSAGDYTNVNKRRKEEAEKHVALTAAYGDRAVFLLQLFGYFNPGYLTFEAAAGIDWAWDHRLEDLGGYLGI